MKVKASELREMDLLVLPNYSLSVLDINPEPLGKNFLVVSGIDQFSVSRRTVYLEPQSIITIERMFQ